MVIGGLRATTLKANRKLKDEEKDSKEVPKLVAPCSSSSF